MHVIYRTARERRPTIINPGLACTGNLVYDFRLIMGVVSMT
jgi:hypothetical protein